jgi:glycerol-3-phosphate dehydrogenase (NAD(P)+)
VENTVVVGTTGWGTTLAVLIARSGAAVSLIAREEAEASELATARENVRRLPGLAFPDNLDVTADCALIAGAGLVVIATPSAALRDNLQKVASWIDPDSTVLSATKGIEPDSGRRMSEVIASFDIEAERICALSGPNFASEIARGLPAATVVAGNDPRRAAAVQTLLNGPTFRVYTSADPVGVELGGALKNIVAIACGLSDGLGYGENARAGLITRSLAEITRLGLAAGAQPMTFLGLAGIGDLVLTCTGDLSRNRRFGLALAAGRGIQAALASVAGVVEGAVTARAMPALARRFGVEMPVCASLHSVLYEGKDPAAAARELMARAPKPEF